jgi:SARP family transcriptional regulator, regulator of embCAB operon
VETCDAPLRIQLCGRLAIERGGAVVGEDDFPARQGRRLWAFLVLHRRQPAGRDDVAAAVWGDAMPDAWDDALSVLASRLRRSLRAITGPCEEPAIQGGEGRYRLALPPSSVVDLERAMAALHRAEGLLRQAAWGAVVAEAQVTIEIAARGFLSGEGGEWVEGQRRLLAEARVHALEGIVVAELARGHAALAEREAEQLVALAPLREAGHRLLMQALVAGGNPGQAVIAYQRCQRLLHEQVGVAPSVEMEALHRQLLRRAEPGP